MSRCAKTRAIAAAAVALVFAVACSSRSPRPLTVAGQPVADQASALAQAEAAFRAQAAAGGATLIAASRCYLTVEPSGSVSGGVCGPVGYASDPADAHWQTLIVAPPSKTGALALRAGPTGQRPSQV